MLANFPGQAHRTSRYLRGILGRVAQPIRISVVVLALGAVAVFVGAGAASGAHGAPSVYWSGSATNGVTHYTSAYNDYVYNWAFNSSGGGPEVEIKEREPGGTVNYVYTGAGEIDNCHPEQYDVTGCEDINGNTISMTCYNETVAC